MTEIATRPKVSELSETDYFKKQNEVIDDFLKATTDAGKLAKMHKLTRAEVVTMIDEWKDYIKSDKSFKEMGRQRLHEMDRHYSIIIREAWEDYHALKDEGKHDKAAPILKLIGDIEAKRQDALQKAGMYDDSELADMVMENERKTEEISKFLMDLVADEPHLKDRVIDALRRIEDPSYVAPVEVKPGQNWTTVNGGELVDG